VRKVRKKTVLNKLNDNLDELKKKKKKTSTKNDKTTTKKNEIKKEKNNSNNIKRKNSNNKKKKNIKEEKIEKKSRSIWKKMLTFILIMGISCILLITAFLGYIVITAPKFEENAFSVKDQTVVYDINGDIIATLGSEKRESVTYDQLPQVLIDAIIATEDSRYFQHNGVDLPRFIKATVYQMLGRSEAGGASTITMQTVKNNLTQKGVLEKNSLDKIIRKFQDVYLSVFKVEKEYSKEKIIELYVNNYNLGSNVYGVGEAAKYYFGKSVSELTLPEASMIAGLFQAPNGHNPYKNMDSAVSRRNTVLNLMVRHNYITEEEANLAKKVSIESLLVGTKDDTIYQGYIDTVVDEVEELTGENAYITPMKIYTTMEKKIQDGINEILDNDAWYWKDDEVQAGIAIVNVKTGAIAAVGAGRNRTGERTFNYATQAYKQPGSTAKPIFDYGPGIEYNNFSSYTLFNDEPWTYTNGPAVNNWDGGFNGLVTLRRALQVSRNVPALKAFQQVGPKNSQKFAYSLGLDVSLNSSSENYRVLKNGLDNTINEAYSIGGSAEGFTPLTMAAAYAGFASGGYYTKPYTVTKIEYRETGETVEYKATKERVMKDSTAYIMNNILESAVQYGFSGGSSVSGSHVAAKTGTTNYDEATMKKYKLPSNAVNDLWTIAYTSEYSIAVWYGYENTTETTYNTSNGGHKDGVMSAVMKYIPKDTKGWSKPSSVVSAEVEKETWPAKLASEYTPSDLKTTEYFVRGTQPTETSDRFAKLNDVTNIKTDKNGNNVTITWEYTPPKVLTQAYLENYFNQSVFGKTKDDLLKERIDYNTNTLGNIGFGIYKQEVDGTLTLINYTENYTYTYNGYGDTTLIIKAEHQKFKSNASNGIKVELKLEELSTEKLIATLEGKSSVTANINSYKEPGIKNVYYGTLDVTTSASIKYQVIVNNNMNNFQTMSALETYMNTLPAGTYEITYIISYLGKEIPKKRTVTLK